MPLGVPRPMIFSSLLLSLRFTRQREDSRFCSFPQRGRRGVKKKTAGDGHSNSLQRFFLASSLIGRTTVFVRCKYTSFPCCWETISELFHLWGRKTPFSINQHNLGSFAIFCPFLTLFQKKVLILWCDKKHKARGGNLRLYIIESAIVFLCSWRDSAKRKPHHNFICAKVQKKFRHPNRKG